MRGQRLRGRFAQERRQRHSAQVAVFILRDCN